MRVAGDVRNRSATSNLNIASLADDETLPMGHRDPGLVRWQSIAGDRPNQHALDEYRKAMQLEAPVWRGL